MFDANELIESQKCLFFGLKNASFKFESVINLSCNRLQLLEGNHE